MARGEGIKHLSELFLKYQKHLKAPQSHVIMVFCEVVTDVLTITLKPEWISYSTTTRKLHLKAPGAVKTEILLHKPELLVHLKGRLGPKNAPSDIL